MQARIGDGTREGAPIRNVAVFAFVGLPLWLVLMWVWLRVSRGVTAATTGLDSSGNLLGTFVFWFLTNVPMWALGGAAWEVVAALVRRLLPGRMAPWAAGLTAPVVLLPYAAMGQIHLFASWLAIGPLLLVLAVYLVLLRRPSLFRAPRDASRMRVDEHLPPISPSPEQ